MSKMFCRNLARTGEYNFAGISKLEKVLWKFTAGDKISSTPVLLDGCLYFESSDGHMYAISEKDGLLKWKYKTNGMVSTPAVAKDAVYFGSHDFNVYALDAYDGAFKWKYATNAEVYGAPSIAENVYIGSFDHNVYALDALNGSCKWKFETGFFIISTPVHGEGAVYVTSRDNSIYALI